MQLFDYLKNIFFALLILQFIPPIAQYLQREYKNLLEPRTKVAVVDIKGLLYNSEEHTKQLYKHFKDQSIKAVLLKIECPGGASGSAQALFNEISTLKKEHVKPVIALVENVCASGGYYVACAADYIIAPGSAIVGSIGTSFPYMFKVKDCMNFLKIRNESAKSGKYKDLTNPFVDTTPEERILLQELLDNAYDQFVQDVANSRKLPLSSASLWAEGKVFTAVQARTLGLIDATGSASNAITIIKEKALIEGEIEWIRTKKARGFSDFFGGDTENDHESMFSLAVQLCTHVAAGLIHRLVPEQSLSAPVCSIE